MTVAEPLAVAEAFKPWAPKPLRRRPGMLELMWRLQANPLEIWKEAHFEEPVLYGENKYRRVISVHDPAAVRRVMVDNAANYGKGVLQQKILGPMLGQGLLTTEGEQWRRARRTLAPLFTPRRTAALSVRMAAAVQRRLDAWRALPVGATVDVEREMTRITFDILSDTLFSGEIDGEVEVFERTLNRAVETLGKVDPLDLLNAADHWPRLTRLSGAPSVARFGRSVRAIVERRRSRLEQGGDAAPDDLLTALLRAQDPETCIGLTTAEVEANVLTFILAGHETTARALGWTLYLLANAPAALAEVEAEAAGLGDDPAEWEGAAPWTRAVLDESMRLYPPAPGFTREAAEADELCGVQIKPGTAVLITPWVLHRHRRLWDQPDRFVPERFLPGARESVDRYAYLPFGAGPRVCIGARFAVQEAVIALAMIVGEFRLTPVSAAPPRPVHRVTLRSARGLHMRLQRR